MSGGATFFGHYRKGLERCVDGVAHCLLGISPERDPDGDRTDACLGRATGPCTTLVAARDTSVPAAVTPPSPGVGRDGFRGVVSDAQRGE